MKIIKQYIFPLVIAIAVLPSFSTKAQGFPPAREQVYVHLNKYTFIAGESMQYKVYLADAQNPGKQSCSKILYFTLTGGGEVISWRINMTGKSVTGDFPLPEALKEGTYQLTAYTNLMLNDDPSTFFRQSIIIASLSKETGNTFRVQSKKETPPTAAEASVNLQVRTNKASYKINEPVTLEISTPANNQKYTDISVSVNAENPFIAKTDLNHITGAIPLMHGNQPQKRYDAGCEYPVEDMGFILSGRIIALQPLTEPCNVWLSVVDSVAPALLYSVTDSAGFFRFFLNRKYDNKELILQLADPANNQGCRMELFTKSVVPDTATVLMSLDSLHEAYLKTNEDIRLIEAVYSLPVEKPASAANEKGLNFLRKPDKIIRPADYAEMRNFKEIASNIVPEVKFSYRNDKFHLMVLSPVDAWKESQLVLLNGVPFTDLAYISTLGTKDIRKIEIIKSNVMVGDITIPGLVSIFTWKTELPESYLKSHTIRYQNTVMDAVNQAQEPTIKTTEKDKHFPGFSNCVYWNPFVKMAGNNPVSLSFPALLLKGRFEVQVEGITEDGIPVNASASFEVTE
jgi:hypothetical protein